jgi:hypothetical protein
MIHNFERFLTSQMFANTWRFLIVIQLYKINYNIDKIYKYKLSPISSNQLK